MANYCDDDDLDDRYGSGNVTAWADTEGDGTGVSDRKTLACTIATAQVDARLENSNQNFKVPITGTVPTLIEDAAVKLAGYWLSTARGVRDYDRETGQPLTPLYADYVDAMTTLDKIANGTLHVTIS